MIAAATAPPILPRQKIVNRNAMIYLVKKIPSYQLVTTPKIMLPYFSRSRVSMRQVEFDESELMFMCKKVQNSSPGDQADFEIDCGNGAVRLPDHFPHSLGPAAEVRGM